MAELTFITGNANKTAYLAEHLGFPLAHRNMDLPEIQELNVEAVVRAKALSAYAEAGGPVLVEDTALCLPALGNLPGPFIKWFEQAIGYEGVCRLLDGKDRAAVAITCFGLCLDGQIELFGGSMPGSISQSPRGESGFGWDVIFIPRGGQQTWAESGPQHKHADNMRRRAMDKLKVRLGGLKLHG